MRRMHITLRWAAELFILGSLISFTACSHLDNNEVNTEEPKPDEESKDSVEINENIKFQYQPIELTESQMQLSGELNDFGFKLYKELGEEGDAMISPLSVSMALSMLANGTAGESQKQLLNALCFKDCSAKDVSVYFNHLSAALKKVGEKTTINIANSIWGNSAMKFTFKDEFASVCQYYFSAMVKALDFGKAESLTEVNKWISDNTGGKITDALNSLTGECVLANAFYFKSEWAVKFEKVSDKKMRIGLRTAYYDSDKFDMVEVPYSDGNYAMDILRPKAGVAPSDLVSIISNGGWSDVLNSFKMADATITMPIFNFRYDTYLQNHIDKLGFNLQNGDFSGIGSPVPSFSSILHKTYIDVNEEGTEAAAVTIIAKEAVLKPEVTVDFNVDKPFLFILRERETGVIVALGQYTSM